MTRERPILFSGGMVRAILDGRKTMTRRAVKPQFASDAEPAEMCAITPEGWQTAGHSGRWWDSCSGNSDEAVRCPYGVPGDRLWVRETWAQNWNQLSDTQIDRAYVYRADGEARAQDNGCDLPWRPSIHMPRSASRITLEVTGVRVERLREISEADAIAEGVERPESGIPICSARQWFRVLWEQINKSWEPDTWVWVVEFRRIAR